MLWIKCLLAASLLSSVLAVPLKSRAASAEEAIPNFAIGQSDKRHANPVPEDEEEFIPNMAIGQYDKRHASPVAEDEEEFIPNMAIGRYDPQGT